MAESNKRSPLETEAIVIGYAMSRLDLGYLKARGCLNWQSAYDEAAKVLSKPPQTFNNLRDEFDPVHPNPRQGWHNRSMRPSRQKVLDELKDLSDDALMELASRILQQDEEIIREAINSLVAVNHVAHNVAERLLTGRRAEEYFLSNSQSIIQVLPQKILDLRYTGCGYDFGVESAPEWAIEVKGLKENKGSIQFTDREWAEAKARRADYWVILVGNLAAQPTAKIFRDPYHLLSVKSRYRQTVAVEWYSTVTI